MMLVTNMGVFLCVIFKTVDYDCPQFIKVG